MYAFTLDFSVRNGRWMVLKHCSRCMTQISIFVSAKSALELIGNPSFTRQKWTYNSRLPLTDSMEKFWLLAETRGKQKVASSCLKTDPGKSLEESRPCISDMQMY